MRGNPAPIHLLLLGLCVFPMASAIAQETEPEANASETAAAVDGEEGAEDPWERLIYLPYKNLKQVFENQGASVVLPYLEYLKMWEKVAGDPDGARPAAIPAVVTRSTYSAEVAKDVARVTAKLTVQVLDKPWVRIPLSFGKAAVGELKSENEKILLQGIGNGSYVLLIGEKGEHEITIELLARVHTSPDGRHFELNCPNVGITTLELSVPESDQTIVIEPAAIQTPITAEGNVTRVKANLGSTNQIIARWNPRESLKPEMELLASVANSTHVTVDEGLIHTVAQLKYEILRGETEQLRIAVPLGHRILDVTAPNAKIRGWKTKVEAKRQMVTVELLSATESDVVIEVHTERTADASAFDAAGISTLR